MYPGAHADKTPHKPALILAETGRAVTFQELESRSLRLANWLRDRGLRRGDVIAVIANNDLRVFDVYWAAQRAGLYITSINYHLHPDEILYILQDSQACVLFIGDISTDISASCHASPTLRYTVAFSEPSLVPGCLSFESLLESASAERPALEPRGADMLYSSGTTGRPKGVRPALPDRRIEDSGDAVVAMFSSQFHSNSETIYYSPAPLYHAAPLRSCAAIQALGGTVVVSQKFDAERALATIERYRITVSQWVPTMFVRMLKLPLESRSGYDVSSMRVAVHAAAPCPVEVKRQMMDWWGPVLYEYYSCTELNGVTVIGPQEWLGKPGSVGRSILGIVHICDEAGVELPIGQNGLIYFERDSLPFTYFGDSEKTRQAQHPTRPTWTAVGDIGRVDVGGFLYLTDRQAFVIISGGVNIYPQEVENALALHPAIADIAVIGVPDTEMGEQVKAIIKLLPGQTPGPQLAQQIIQFARTKVASYKVPKSIEFVEDLPRSPTGKLLKGELRKRYMDKQP